jgi:hypothetical protein
MKLAALARRVEYSKDDAIQEDCRKYAPQLTAVLERTMEEVFSRLDARDAGRFPESNAGE